MNNVIIWGSLIIPYQLLMLVLSGIAGYWGLSYRLKKLERNSTQAHNTVLDELFNIAIIGLFIWKLSPLIFDTTFVIQNPLSLLYFSGGTKGLLLAALYAMVILSYRTRKKGHPILLYPDAILTLLLVGGGIYALLLFSFGDGGLVTAMLAPVALILYYLQLQRNRNLGSKMARGQIVSKWGNLVTALIVVGLIGWVVNDALNNESDSSSAYTSDSGTGIRIGDKAVDFTLTTIEGKQVNLSDYRGQRVLLNFWATWCPPCKAEMPHMQKFYSSYRDDGVVILGVNLTNTEKSPKRVTAFVKDYELTFPIVLDQSGGVSDIYKVVAYPTSFIIDESGIIRDIYQGTISYDVMKRAVQDL